LSASVAPKLLRTPAIRSRASFFQVLIDRGCEQFLDLRLILFSGVASTTPVSMRFSDFLALQRP